MTFQITITGDITINVPALSEYVAYLKARDGVQPQIDALSGGLKTSTDKLAAAMAAVSTENQSNPGGSNNG